MRFLFGSEFSVNFGRQKREKSDAFQQSYQLCMRMTNSEWEKSAKKTEKKKSSQSFDSWIFVSRLCLSMHMKGKRYSLSELKAITK